MIFEIMKYNCKLTDVPNRFYMYYLFIYQSKECIDQLSWKEKIGFLIMIGVFFLSFI